MTENNPMTQWLVYNNDDNENINFRIVMHRTVGIFPRYGNQCHLWITMSLMYWCICIPIHGAEIEQNKANYRQKKYVA